MAREKGFTLIELMIVIAIIAVIATIAIPGLLQAQRASNERNASSSLKTLASAEADFRANDRNGNKVLDFWTLDVAGLHTIINYIDLAHPQPQIINLIEPSVAGADADPNPAAGAPANYTPITDYIPVQSYKAGYWYAAMNQDLSIAGQPVTYRAATDGLDQNGNPDIAQAYSYWNFGFVCFPESLTNGKWVFIINESKTIYRQGLAEDVRDPANGVPAGRPLDPATGGQINSWPNNSQLKAFWQKMD